MHGVLQMEGLGMKKTRGRIIDNEGVGRIRGRRRNTRAVIGGASHSFSVSHNGGDTR